MASRILRGRCGVGVAASGAELSRYTEGKKKEKLNYMHANPVKRGLVNRPKDWKWSSWSIIGAKRCH